MVERIGDHTQAALTDLINTLGPTQEPADALVTAARDAIAGGKRLRGLWVMLGYALATGRAWGDCDDSIARLAGAAELYQASALAHDDLIDHAQTRRGRPTAHVVFAQMHRDQGWTGDAGEFGTAGALLVGDFLLSAADFTATRVANPAVLRQLTLMHAEVALGQYLDIVNEQPALDHFDLDVIMEVIRRKSARYSVAHPTVLGLLAGGRADMVEAVQRVIEPWGIAFQLRDDELGVFGDPQTTGKPAGGDLIEGKRTALLALTWEHASAEQRHAIATLIGSPDGVIDLQGIIEQVGRQPHEQLIDTVTQQGRDALAALGEHSRTLLSEMEPMLTTRRA